MPKRVTLFVQCLVDGLYPTVAEAMEVCLRRLGLKVDCPLDQTCCGQPAFNAGYRRQAQAAARHFIACFENAGDIVCPSGSCVDMVRHHYPTLFENQPDWQARARALAARTYEFSQYLVDRLQIEDVGARYRGRVTYHDSCHLLRGLGVAEQPRRLIRAVAGIEFTEMVDSDRCCGFGGSFAVKYPPISHAMVAEKAATIEATGAGLVIGCDMGCLMNIQGYLSRNGSQIKVMHLAELLNQR